MAEDKVTKADLAKTLEVHAKTIELQILTSQQQERLIEKLETMEKLVEKVEGHFNNGFKSEIKDHVTKELVREMGRFGDILEKINDNLEKMNAKLDDQSKNTNEKLDSIDERGWKQTWIWAGIALFSIVNAIGLLYNMFVNGWVVKSG